MPTMQELLAQQKLINDRMAGHTPAKEVEKPKTTTRRKTNGTTKQKTQPKKQEIR